MILFKNIIFFGLVGLAIVSPPLAGLGLLLGYAVADKFFALINIANLVHVPIFITEPVLFILFIRAFYRSYQLKTLDQWQLDRESPWPWFYGVGLINIIFGCLLNSPILVFRDAVIVLYGIITQITVTYVKKIQHIKIIFFVILGGLVSRLLLELFHPIFGHGSSLFGMYAAFIVLGCFCTYPLWGRFKGLAFLILMLLTGLITATDIRTVWVALLMTIVLTVGLSFLLREPLKFPAIGFAAILSSVVLTLVFLKVVIPDQYRVIHAEFFTMFAGEKSPNLLTRVAMWEDAISEVVPSTNKVFDNFDRKVLNPHYYGSEKRPGKKQMDEISRNSTVYSSKDPSATDILTDYGKSDSREGTSEDLRSRIAAKIEKNKILQTLFGVPFGQRFVPERISAIHKVNRYDPHNSFIAMLYRTGLIGFFLFLFITGRTFLNAYKSLKAETEPERKYVLLAVMSCLIYHMGHSMTDVTLENPFRGGPFWLLLGLMIVLTSKVNKEERKI